MAGAIGDWLEPLVGGGVLGGALGDWLGPLGVGWGRWGLAGAVRDWLGPFLTCWGRWALAGAVGVSDSYQRGSARVQGRELRPMEPGVGAQCQGAWRHPPTSART